MSVDISHSPNNAENDETMYEEQPEWAATRVDSRVGFIGREDSFSSPSTRSRVRSIECVAIDVNITGSNIVSASEKSGAYVEYIIEVAPGLAKRWTVNRRYNDFVYLDNQLKKPSGQTKLKLPPLPRKRYFGSSTEPKFVEERRSQLEEYLKSIVAIPHVWIRSDLPRFLDNESNSMIFIWNFERVKRMQEIVNTMSIENKNDKEKLNEELVAAKEQVSALQNRINRMEMMFLQHAAGLAREPLSSRAMRSISHGDIRAEDLSFLHRDNLDYEESNDTDSVKTNSPTPHSPIRAAIEDADARDVMQNFESNVKSEDSVFLDSIISKYITDGKQLNHSEIVDILKLTMNQDDIIDEKAVNQIRTKSEDEMRAWALSIKLKETLSLGNEILEDQYNLAGNNSYTKMPSFSGKSDIDSISSLTSTKLESLSSYNENKRRQSEQSTDEAVKRLLDLNDINSSESTSNKSLTGATNLCNYFDQILNHLIPSPEIQEERLKVFEYLRALVFTKLGAHIFPVGSFLTNTYLPNGDIDVTAFFLHQEDESWFVRVNEILCMTAFEGSGYLSAYVSNPIAGDSNTEKSLHNAADSKTVTNETRFTINNVSFVNADIKLIKSSINGVSIDLSANQIGAIYLQYFFELLDDFVGQNHLFKRSILLIKAWCTYESYKYSRGAGSVVGSKEGRLSTSSLNVMTSWIFNLHGKKIKHPLQALYYFLSFYSTFDWNTYTITIHGPLSARDLSEIKYERSGSLIDETMNAGLASSEEHFFPNDLLDCMKQRYIEGRESCISNALFPVLQQLGYTAPTPHNPQSIESNKNPESTIENSIPDSESQYQQMLQLPEVIEAQNRFVKSWITSSAFGDAATFYKRGLINVMNPVAPKNNISRAVDMYGFKAIQCAFKEGFIALRLFIEKMDFAGRDDSSILSHEKVSLAQYLINMNSSQGIESTRSNDHTGPSFFASAISEFMSNTTTNIILPLLCGTSSSHPSRRLVATSTNASNLTKSINSDSNEDSIKSQNRQFSLSFAELILGCRLNQDVIISLITQVLMQRGSLPVGEIGKMLQLLTGGDSVSRRVKEQFGGLKKTIELASSSGIRVGVDHPFNPMISLDSSRPEDSNSNVVSDPTILTNKLSFTSNKISSLSLGHSYKSLNHASKIVSYVIAANIKEPKEKSNNWNTGNNSTIANKKLGYNTRPAYVNSATVNNSGGRPAKTENFNNVNRGQNVYGRPSSGNNGKSGVYGREYLDQFASTDSYDDSNQFYSRNLALSPGNTRSIMIPGNNGPSGSSIALSPGRGLSNSYVPPGSLTSQPQSPFLVALNEPTTGNASNVGAGSVPIIIDNDTQSQSVYVPNIYAIPARGNPSSGFNTIPTVGNTSSSGMPYNAYTSMGAAQPLSPLQYQQYQQYQQQQQMLQQHYPQMQQMQQQQVPMQRSMQYQYPPQVPQLQPYMPGYYPSGSTSPVPPPPHQQTSPSSQNQSKTSKHS